MKDYSKLVRKVFKSSDGQELLKAWNEIHCHHLHDENPNMVYYRLGIFEFIKGIEDFVSFKSKSISEVDVDE